MITQRHNTIAQRAGQFLDEIFPGPHKDKRLAQHLGISSNMASLLRRGQSWTIDRLDQLRDLHGWDFVRYVFEAPEPDFAALRATLHNVLRQLPVSTPTMTYLWFDDAGKLWQAPAGHAEFVRRRTGLSIHVQGDLVTSTCRNLHWIALTLDTAGHLIIRHHAIGASPSAVRSCSDWLYQHGTDLTRVRRIVDVDGSLAEVEHDSVAAAVLALERILAHRNTTVPPFAAERKSLDETPADMGRVLNAYIESPEHVLAAAIDAGLMPMSSILTVRGSSVTNDFMGDAVGLDRSDIVGKNVLDRKDPAYGAFVHSQITAAVKEPVLSEVKGVAYGMKLHYLRAAIPAGNSQVLSLVRPIIRRVC
jgi:hypothetical protein